MRERTDGEFLRNSWPSPLEFQLVLMGSRLQLEGCRDGDEPLCCSTLLEPQDTPLDMAHELIAHPSCAV